MKCPKCGEDLVDDGITKVLVHRDGNIYCEYGIVQKNQQEAVNGRRSEK